MSADTLLPIFVHHIQFRYFSITVRVTHRLKKLSAAKSDECIPIGSDTDDFLFISFEGFFDCFKRITAVAIKKVIQLCQFRRVSELRRTKINHNYNSSFILNFRKGFQRDVSLWRVRERAEAERRLWRIKRGIRPSEQGSGRRRSCRDAPRPLRTVESPRTFLPFPPSPFNASPADTKARRRAAAQERRRRTRCGGSARAYRARRAGSARTARRCPRAARGVRRARRCR